MIVCSAESIVLSLSKNRLAKNFTILLFYIACRWIETAKTSPSYFELRRAMLSVEYTSGQ